MQSWLHAAGIDYPLVEGGYKALRQTAIQATIELAQKPIVLIGGCTGSGKTLLVQQQPNGVDLEGLARHRGSAFGRTLQPQLSQASFENLLAAEMLKNRRPSEFAPVGAGRRKPDDRFESPAGMPARANDPVRRLR